MALTCNQFLDEADKLQAPRRAGRRGRPSKYPVVVAVIYALFIAHHDGKPGAGRFMRDHWPEISDALRDRYPDFDCFDANTDWMRRQRYEDYKARYHLHGERLNTVFEAFAARVAVEVGCADPAQGSATFPARCNTVAGDGTALASLYKHRRGEMSQRRDGSTYEPASDPDAAEHTTGDKRKVWGTKWVLLSNHNGNENGLVITSLRPQARGGGELDTGLAMIADLKQRLPGLKAVCWDMAARGVHNAEILKQGLIPFVKLHGGAKKPFYLGKEKATTSTQTTFVDLYAVDGHAHVLFVNEGIKTMVPLTIKQVHWRRTLTGQSHFIESKLPDDPRVPVALRDATVWFRITSNDWDDATNKKRAEYLRVHGVETQTFTDLYPHRNVAETSNGVIKLGQRAHSKTQNMQHLDLIGAALYRNLQTLLMHEQRVAASGDPPGMTQAA